jgi:hypothetical protein
MQVIQSDIVSKISAKPTDDWTEFVQALTKELQDKKQELDQIFEKMLHSSTSCRDELTEFQTETTAYLKAIREEIETRFSSQSTAKPTLAMVDKWEMDIKNAISAEEERLQMQNTSSCSIM